MIKKKIIIVGGGTAGSVISKNLANRYSVSLFESSRQKALPKLFDIPLLVGFLYNKYNKFIKKIEIPFNAERKVPFFVSNVLGGSSAMNGCVHVMGDKVGWEMLLERFGFNYDDLSESYKNIFSKSSEKNKISLKTAKVSDVDLVFFKALEDIGVPKGDVEWIDGVQSGSVYNAVGRVFRSSVNNLNPYENVSLNIGFEVENLIVDDQRNVIGVFSNGECYLSDCVILCGGVIGSNKILRRKAVRYSDMSLVDLGLDVGFGIKDHTNLRVNVVASRKINSLNEIGNSNLKKFWLALRHLLGFKTLMMGTGATSAAHLDLDEDGVIDTRIQVLNFSENGRIGSEGKLFSTCEPGFSISITPISPLSFGEFNEIDGDLSIKPNYLSLKKDVETLENALSFVINLLKSSAFSAIVKNIENVDIINNDPSSYIYKNCYSGYHLIGGCDRAVNNNFQITSVGNLYVCDASVMSEHISSNIHAVVAVIADLFSKKFNI